MRYLPKSDAERRQMLDVCGLSSLDELYAHLPEAALLKRPLTLDRGKSEYEIADYFQTLGAQGAAGYASFLGAGVYAHYRPVVCDTIASRGEFLTSYTPYQAEMAQGTLTSIFEFQTMICQLTGMEVANASMYDGSTGVAEAALMAMRITGRGRVVTARTVHPEYREVLSTTSRNDRFDIAEAAYVAGSGRVDLASVEAQLGKDVACVIVQSPNFFGVVEEIKPLAELAHKHGALLVYVFSEAVSLGLMAPPTDADIVVGELQSFAGSPNYGGPSAGVIATKEKFIRQIPGRLVGETKDAAGNRAYCLTLSTREQHIRREKATSNICTNQALIALYATVFLALYGKQGLRDLASQNLAKAHYLADGLTRRFDAPFFNEVVVQLKPGRAAKANAELLGKKVIGGLELERFYPELKDCVLVCATEMNRRVDIDSVKEAYRQ